MKKSFLEVEVFVGDQSLPVANATVLVKNNAGNVLYRLTTDKNGIAEPVVLDCPDIIDTGAHEPPPFATYDIEVPQTAGYKRLIIHDVQIFDGVTSVLPIQLHPAVIGNTPEQNTEEIYIPREHGVDMPKNQSDRADFENYVSSGINMMELPSANEVKIPDYITVHLGSPNSNARDVRVPFKEYIKNVASSEIFPTWEESAIYANVYCQISFALNRIYTVWYRSRGKDFDITSYRKNPIA